MVAAMARRKISTTVYVTPEQDQLLKSLSSRTKVPVAEYIRQGIDLILARHSADLPGQESIRFDRPSDRPSDHPSDHPNHADAFSTSGR